jgi:hypothetical protein
MIVCASKSAELFLVGNTFNRYIPICSDVLPGIIAYRTGFTLRLVGFSVLHAARRADE